MNAKQLDAATGCTMVVANDWAHPLNIAINRWGIRKVPEFLAQCAHESAGFTRVEESLQYRTAERIMQVWPSRFETLKVAERYVNSPTDLANFVYAGRNGNGDERSGDGWAFRGRGLLQLTGRANYAKYEYASGAAITAAPWLLLQLGYAADSAAWYWSDRNIDDLTDITAITKAVNGGTHGLDKRAALTERALQAFA